jgi:transposase
MTTDSKRYVAFDIHKHYVMVGAVNEEKEVILQPYRVLVNDLEEWIEAHLLSSDAVVLEASTNVWLIYDLLEPHVDQIVVVHPKHVKVIAMSSVKTDKRDTLALARLLAANLLTSVWVPSGEVRELRALVAHRRWLVKQRVSTRNRLHAVLHTHNLTPPEGDPFSQANRDWWKDLALSSSTQLRIRQDLTLLDQFSELIQEVEAEMAQISVSATWASQLPFVMQLPGFGLLNTMTVLSAIGTISRFPSPKNLVGYAGLGARVHLSGQKHITGRITKQGRSELRQVMVEAAWSAVRHYDHWRRQYQALASRIGSQKAIVAIARKLLVVVWHVLTEQRADRFADPKAVARKFLTWGSRHRLARSLGMSRNSFVEYYMQYIGFSEQVIQSST